MLVQPGPRSGLTQTCGPSDGLTKYEIRSVVMEDIRTERVCEQLSNASSGTQFVSKRIAWTLCSSYLRSTIQAPCLRTRKFRRKSLISVVEIQQDFRSLCPSIILMAQLALAQRRIFLVAGAELLRGSSFEGGSVSMVLPDACICGKPR